MVSAPEIRGLWDFTLIPGTEVTDESGKTYIDRSDFITGSATMMIKTEDELLRNNSWEFMKWWADADTQVRFGREIEALLGSSARYATANKDARVYEEPTSTSNVVYNISVAQNVTIVGDAPYFYEVEFPDPETGETVTGYIYKGNLVIIDQEEPTTEPEETEIATEMTEQYS